MLRLLGKAPQGSLRRLVPHAVARRAIYSSPAQDGSDALIFTEEECQHAKGDRLVDVLTQESDGEITVYIKGFLSKGESSMSFEPWRRSHLMLCGTLSDEGQSVSAVSGVLNYVNERLGQVEGSERRRPPPPKYEGLPWGPRMCGYYWQSGELAQIGSAPVPIATLMNAAYHGYRVFTTATRWIPSPHRIAMTAVSEVGLTAGQLIMQYRSAVAHIRAHGHVLAKNLSALRKEKGYKRVRVVAHSLGCKLLLQAISELSDEDVPDEVHLCAPAAREKDVKNELGRAAKERLFVYHCSRDLVLNTAFRVMEFGPALGSAGPSADMLEQCNKRMDATAIDASHLFGFMVHSDYRFKLPTLIREGYGLIDPNDL